MWHDKIVQDMWDDDLHVCEEWGTVDDTDESTDNSYDEEED